MDLFIGVIYTVVFYVIGGAIVFRKVNESMRFYYFLTIPASLGFGYLFYISPNWWGEGGPEVITSIVAGFSVMSAFGIILIFYYGLIAYRKAQGKAEFDDRPNKSQDE